MVTYLHSGKAVIALSMALILAATLFPFDFDFEGHISIREQFSPGGAIGSRGNDLIIGADAALTQGFTGTLSDLRIWSYALTSEQVAKEARVKVRAAQGCAACYFFADASGGVLKDGSGKGNHGTLVGGPRWISDDRSAGLVFDGSGQHVRVPNSPSIDIGGRRMSILMRVALEDSTADGVIVAKPWHRGAMAPPYYQYGVEFGKLKRSVDFYFADTRGRLWGPFSVSPPVGSWTHIAFVYDGTVRGYVDGRELLVANPSQPWQLSDIVGNLLLFVPLGFGLAAAGRSKGIAPRNTIAFSGALGMTVSLGVEILQCWLPSREPSWFDIAANSAGAALGAGFYVAAGLQVLERLKALRRDRSVRPDRL